MSKRFFHFTTLLLSTVMLMSCGQAEDQIAIAAHRGFWKTEECKDAQNSIKALQLAQQHHFWGSECDVQLTKDNQVLVNHDDVIAGKRINLHLAEDFDAVRLSNGEKVSTFAEYLEQTQQSKTTKLVIEIKPAESDARSIHLSNLCIEQLIDQQLYDPERIMFISFSLAVCKHLAIVAPEFTNQYLNGELSPEELQELGINGLDYDFNVFYKHPEWVARAHELGMTVNAWTVNDDKDLQAMIDLGLDCITTNFPLRLRELLGKREKRIK